MPDVGIGRRQLLVGAAGLLGVSALGVAGVETGVLPGLGAAELPAGVPHDRPGALVDGSFRSRRRGGATVGWTIAFPPHGATTRLPVLVVLHGRGGTHSAAFGGSLHLERYLARFVLAGGAPFAIAAADGGDHEYWHPRRGTDPAGMITEEFLPLLGRHGLDVRRIGLLGWSMGGYGALYLASVLGPTRCAVAVAESPAVWAGAGQTVEGAFDDAADFHAHTVVGHEQRLDGIPLRLDCGDRDGFALITRLMRSRVTPTPAGGIEPGGHDSTYWRSQAPAQLAFVAQHLTTRG